MGRSWRCSTSGPRWRPDGRRRRWPGVTNGQPLPEVGAEVVVTGHVRRRFFRAGGGTQSRTEVVADAVVPARSRARVRRAIDDAVAAGARAGVPMTQAHRRRGERAPAGRPGRRLRCGHGSGGLVRLPQICREGALVDLHALLGDDADDLLNHTSKGIPKEDLHLPGPDFIDRVPGADRPLAAGAAQPASRCSATVGWPAPATCRSCRSTRASSTRRRRRSRRTRSTSTRRTSSSWRSRAAATRWPRRSACSAR